jgi:ribonuclease HII
VTADPLAALFAELGRLRDLSRLEHEVGLRGFARIAGVDEAGRGSLAGPVVAAAVILPARCILPGLDDSKKLDAEARERLDRHIRRCAIAFAVGVVDARRIDADDILRASLEAMRVAVLGLVPGAEALLVDAVSVPGVRMPQVPVVHGDALCVSIAAASVVAKVHRDRLLDELARRHPAYGFEHHKGYGTPEHWDALRRYGPCPEHRLTYRGVVPEPAAEAPPTPSSGRRRSRTG